MSVLVSPVGFERWKIAEPIKAIRPSRVELVHTSHPRSLDNMDSLAPLFEAVGTQARRHLVKDAFDFVQWFQALDRIVGASNQDMVINITASHGVALSMACMVAAQRSLGCVCFDKEEGALHHVSPSVIFHLRELHGTDRAILRELSGAERTVGETANAAAVEMTTASASLQRLYKRGFVARREQGRQVLYSLRPGVREFLDSVLG